MPAAIASGLPESVPAWYTGPLGATCSIRSRRPPYAATGSPPPITLPSVVRSAVTPKRSAAPPGAMRNPVITSSKISSAPCSSASRAQRGQERRIGRDEPRVADHRLDDDRRDATGVAPQQRLDARPRR